MEFGWSMGGWIGGPPHSGQEVVMRAESLGYDSIWWGESYGSDALTPLAWWGTRTHRIRLGTSIVQIPARTPAATAMAAMTLDHLTRGRFVLGLGISGPQVVEGWYGTPFRRPLQRTREFVEIVRAVVSREGPVSIEGDCYQLPLATPENLGRPLKSMIKPFRESIPIMIAAQGPMNTRLAAEIGDGWLPFLFSPDLDDEYRRLLDDGFTDRGSGTRSSQDFEVLVTVPVSIHEDVELAADRVRKTLALYIGGMGARNNNFHVNAISRMGFDSVARRVQDQFQNNDRAGAEAAIPLELVEQLALVGPIDKIQRDLARWQTSVATTVIFQGDADSMAELAQLRSPHAVI